MLAHGPTSGAMSYHVHNGLGPSSVVTLRRALRRCLVASTVPIAEAPCSARASAATIAYAVRGPPSLCEVAIHAFSRQRATPSVAALLHPLDHSIGAQGRPRLGEVATRAGGDSGQQPLTALPPPPCRLFM